MKIRCLAAFAVVALVACFSVFAAPLKQAQITVSGYSGETSLENFPVLVRVSESVISGFSYADCQTDGSDISFTLEDGTVLAHEIDTWDTTGESLVWVKLPALAGTDTSFYFRWKDSAPLANNPSAVWSAGYAGVWHMNGASGITSDSTANELDATPTGNTDNSIGVSGKIGTARQTATDAAFGCLMIPNYDHLALGDTFTLSGWLNMSSDKGERRIANRKISWNASDGWELESRGGYNKINVRGSNSGIFDVTTPSTQATWVHLAFVYNGTSSTVYTNGVYAAAGTVAAVNDNGQPMALGGQINGDTVRYTRGYYDEWRLLDGVPSADWVKAEYASASDAGFLSYGVAEAAITATENISGGALQDVSIVFGAADAERTLYAAYASAFCGNDLSEWSERGIAVATIAAGETSASWTPDESWGSGDRLVVRFYFERENGTVEWSNPVYWRVYDTPVATDIVCTSDSWNTLTVKGVASALGGENCAISVYVGLSSETMTNVWENLAGSTLTATGAFELTLEGGEIGSVRYFAPDRTYYVSLILEGSAGAVVRTDAVPVVAARKGTWTYYETTTDDEESGSGYLSDGVWKFDATRSDGNCLAVSASAGAFYGVEPQPVDFSTIKNPGLTVNYKVVAFGGFSAYNANSAGTLFSSKDMMSSFIAPDCLKIEASHCFCKCLSLETVELNEETVFGGNSTFEGCSSLENFTPRILRSESGKFNTLFNGCSKLTGKFEITEATALNGAFQGTSVEEIYAPKVTILSNRDFYNCKSLTNVVVAAAVTSIGENALRNTKVTLPFVQSLLDMESLTTVGKYVFKDCTALDGVLEWNRDDLPVTDEMFQKCSGLKGVVFNALPLSIGANAFNNIASGAEVRFYKKALPADADSYSAGAVSRSNLAFPKVYLCGDEEAWLDVIGEKNAVLLADDFNNTEWTGSDAKGDRTWATVTDLMAKDSTMCTKADGVVTILGRRVMAFVYYNGSGCWILRAPKNGLTLFVR